MDRTCGKCGNEQGHDGLGDFRATAGEDIHGGIAVLRPRVDGKVAFRDDDHAADTLRGEVVEMRGNERSSTFFRAVAEAGFQTTHVIEHLRRTAGEFCENVPSCRHRR